MLLFVIFCTAHYVFKQIWAWNKHLVHLGTREWDHSWLTWTKALIGERSEPKFFWHFCLKIARQREFLTKFGHFSFKINNQKITASDASRKKLGYIVYQGSDMSWFWGGKSDKSCCSPFICLIFDWKILGKSDFLADIWKKSDFLPHFVWFVPIFAWSVLILKNFWSAPWLRWIKWNQRGIGIINN